MLIYGKIIVVSVVHVGGKPVDANHLFDERNDGAMCAKLSTYDKIGHKNL
jgi:hypothetical protein